MGAFDQIHILPTVDDGSNPESKPYPLISVGAGCKTGDIIRKTMAARVTVPLGARPSVGAGLWLQGGIGHLARLHGLACDNIIGAVMASVDSGQILCVGHVPDQCWPAGAVRPDNESEILWAIRGAGTNFGIVISVVFKSYKAPTYFTRNWVVGLNSDLEARLRLNDFEKLVDGELDRDRSADAYLYWEGGQLRLGVMLLESTSNTSATFAPMPVDAKWVAEIPWNTVEGVGIFEIEMYVSGMHGGHGSGKTSSFKRCIFLKNIGEENIANRLIAAIKTRPSPLCYLHLL